MSPCRPFQFPLLSIIEVHSLPTTMDQEETRAEDEKQNGVRSLASVPKAVVGRLSLYLRELQFLLRQGCETVSSVQLGKALGFTDAQVRKDLAYFGQFGYPGIGYRCGELVTEIKKIMGTDRPWSVALIGCGNLGRALLGYRGFLQKGFKIIAAFDIDPEKTESDFEGIPVYDIDELGRLAEEFQIRLAILAVPANAANEVAQKVSNAGINGILNFAPVTLNTVEGISSVGVDLAIELEQLCYSVVKKKNDENS
ncbi:MAG: redox-sensing transcriptional repressor Rex [Planctomycetota bacterium]|nr:redox-sensing transcriptional repressor Rex [Planctomycetota bacterium]